MKTIVKRISKLTDEEYRACLYLNYRGGGQMMGELVNQKDSDSAYAIMLWEDKLIGWALMVPHDEAISHHSNSYQKKKSRYVVHFYVRAMYRNRGYGTKLMNSVKEIDATPTVIPWDKASGGFFSKHKVVTDHIGRKTIRRVERVRNEAKK